MSAWSSGKPGNLPQRLLEYLNRLTTLNQVLVIDDHGGDGMNTLILKERLLLPHHRRELVAVENPCCPCGIEPHTGGRANQHLMIGGVLAISELRLEQRLLERQLTSFEGRPVQQAMGIKGVVDATARLQAEGEAQRRTGRTNPLAHQGCLLGG